LGIDKRLPMVNNTVMSKGKFTKRINETMDFLGMLMPGMGVKNKETMKRWLDVQFSLVHSDGQLMGLEKGKAIMEATKEEKKD